MQCATRTAAHGRLARLSPAAEPTRSFMFLDSLCSLFCPPLYSPGPQEGKKNTKSYVSSTCISFSLPPSISQAACAAGGSVWVQAARRTEVWVHRPRAAQGAGGVPRAACRGQHAEGRPRDVQVSSEGQLVPAGPRCSRCFQMFRMKKHFPEKASDVQFAEQTGRGYKHHVRSVWGPQAPGAGGVFGDPPAEWGEIQGVHPLAKSLLVI